MHVHTHARKVFYNLPSQALAGGRLKYNCGNISLIAPLFQLSLKPKSIKSIAMATGVVKYPPKPT